MTEPQTVTGFDKAERERVQVALRRYMEEHGIGTPTLQARIIKADTPRHREIPLSTLQRLITGSHHTQDHHVAVCHAFVKDLPHYSAENQLLGLGQSIAAFLLAPQDKEGAPPDPNSLTGEFNGRVVAPPPPLPPEIRGPHVVEDNWHGDIVAYSTIVFQPASAGRYLRVSERVFNPNAVDLREHPGQPSYAYEGVAVMTSSDTIVAIQRDLLTRQPRTCYLTRASNPSDNVPTQYYVQAIWVPFQSRPVEGDLTSQIEFIYLPSAADDRRNSEESAQALSAGPERSQ